MKNYLNEPDSNDSWHNQSQHIDWQNVKLRSIASTVETTKWLSSEDVCHILKISKRTLQSYRDRGILPFAQISRKIYYKASDIDEYLERHYIRAHYQEGGSHAY